MKTHMTSEQSPAHSEPRTAGAGQAALAASPAAATLQRYQQLANNSPQAMQLKQQAETQRRTLAGGELTQAMLGSVVQRAVKWWPTNPGHTAVTGGPSDQKPGGGAYVSREKAGPNDQLLSTEGEAWGVAKAASLHHRPANKDLFPKTTERMEKGDGDRTYLTYEGSKKAISIVVTHTTDPQSQVRTETGANLKVTHAHSASGNYAQVSPALSHGEHPDYKNDAESKVHYLSLTLQAGEGRGGEKERKSRSESDADEPGEEYADDAVGEKDLSAPEKSVEDNPGLGPPIRLGPDELLYAHVAGYTDPSMLSSWRASLAYKKYAAALETHSGKIPVEERNALIDWIKSNKPD